MNTIILILFALPVAYLLTSYIYLVTWHKKWWLFPVLTHEDGRHTMWGSISYWPHFLACLPTALFTSLCLAGAVLMETHFNVKPAHQLLMPGVILLASGFIFTLLVTWGSINQVGLKETIHYALQKFERDNVSSWGGCWNQFVPSNIVIGAGSIAIGLVAGKSILCSNANSTFLQDTLSFKNYWLLLFAIVWFLWLCFVFRTGRRSFTETRWLAHSVREIATYPFTAVPAGLGAIIFSVNYQNFVCNWSLIISPLPVVLFSLAFLFFAWQLIALRNKDVLAISQKPQFAPQGLSVPYLLAAHVFEHVTDIIFIAITTPGFYLFGLWLLSV